MFSAEELQSWNELFPHCKIHESDLANPTEAFLVKTLTAYLGMFGYKVEPPSQIVHVANAGNSRENRIFLVKLSRSIDKMLKITDKSYAFTFYDLIRPTPKKTSHMLGILLNYLYYYNMYKTESIKMGTGRLKERQELLDAIGKNLAHYKSQEEKLEEVEAKLAELAIKTPKMTQKARALQAQVDSEKEELKMVQNSVDNLSATLEEMRSMKRSLKPKVVPENEAEELQNQVTNMQKALEENRQTEVSIEAYLKDGKEQVQRLEAVLKRIKETEAVMPPGLLDLIMDSMKKFKDSEVKLAALQHTKQTSIEKTEKLRQVIRKFGERHTSKRNQILKDKENDATLFSELLAEKRRFETKLNCEKANERTLLMILQKETEFCQFLIQSCDSLMIPTDIQ